jgi:hypothetical protein
MAALRLAPPVRLTCLLAALPCGLLPAADPQLSINVNASRTDAGKKAATPTPASPVFYFPVVGGYQERGLLAAGETKPPAKDVVHLLAKALAGQGYLVYSPGKTPPPAVLLVFFWGYINPQIDNAGVDPSLAQRFFFNQPEMLALVGGDTLDHLDLDFEREEVMQAAEQDRYFVMVSAFDFPAALKHKKVKLWSARMSVPSAGISIMDALPALISQGAPLFGRETVRPVWITVPAAPEGRVEVGQPVVAPGNAAGKSAAAPAR